MCYFKFKSFVVIILVFFVSCSNEKDLGRKLIHADNTDEAIIYAKKIESFEEKGLPIFVEILNTLIDDQHRLNSYGKINICIDSLYNLAKKGIYSQYEAMALLKIIEVQKYIPDTLKTANILRIVTGIDVGYDEEFVKKYTAGDENQRIKMIQKWKVAITEKGISSLND